GDACTQGDVCTNGHCAGTEGADSDGDGYCDATEAALGCNPNDGSEIPPQSTAYAGGHGAGDILVTYLVPTDRTVAKASDPAEARGGKGRGPGGGAGGAWGGGGLCTAGKVGDRCTTNAQCNQPANTCRIVANYGAVADLAVRKPFTLNRKTLLTGFEPLTPG